MKFQPKTEKQIREEMLWPAGNYSFEIIKATDKVSKKGNDMIELELKVYNDDGKFIFVRDWLLASMEFKLRHAVDCMGLSAKYNTGALAANDFAHQAGVVKLKQETGEYPKNVVADYVVPKGEEVAEEPAKKAAPKKTVAEELDDEIPWN